MGEHAQKFIYLRQKQGRNTIPERKGVGILSKEAECRKSETRQKYTLRKESECPE